MSATVKNSLQFFLEMLRKEHDVESDTLKVALMVSVYTFDEATHLAFDTNQWVASTAYSLGDTTKPTTENGYIYKATAAGTSDSSEPIWPTTIGGTVTDGGVTWECWSVNASESEIAAGNGYTAGGQTLTTVAASMNTTDGRVEVDADNPSWTAASGAIATTGSAIVYNDSHASKTIVQHINFSADYDTPDGKVFQINMSDGLRWFQNQT